MSSVSDDRKKVESVFVYDMWICGMGHVLRDVFDEWSCMMILVWRGAKERDAANEDAF